MQVHHTIDGPALLHQVCGRLRLTRYVEENLKLLAACPLITKRMHNSKVVINLWQLVPCFPLQLSLLLIYPPLHLSHFPHGCVIRVAHYYVRVVVVIAVSLVSWCWRLPLGSQRLWSCLEVRQEARAGCRRSCRESTRRELLQEAATAVYY